MLNLNLKEERGKLKDPTRLHLEREKLPAGALLFRLIGDAHWSVNSRNCIIYKRRHFKAISICVEGWDVRSRGAPGIWNVQKSKERVKSSQREK